MVRYMNSSVVFWSDMQVIHFVSLSSAEKDWMGAMMWDHILKNILYKFGSLNFQLTVKILCPSCAMFILILAGIRL